MSETTTTSVAISARDRAVIGPELGAFVERLSGDTRAAYEALAAQIEAGEVSGPELERLESFLELALTTGRVRQRLGQHAEDAVKRVFERTPRGAALASSADEVTRALAPLVGQPLKELRLSLVRPGTYRLVVETEQHRVSVGLAPAGAHVESVETTL